MTVRTDPLERLRSALAERYHIDRELGAGGMALVFLAEDLRHRRRVALKVLRPELAAEIGPERFLREIEMAARLNHPHVLPVFDSGEAGHFLFYVMPYVEGESLRGRLDREKQLPVHDALQIAREVADALSYAHRQGVVHRDIKPENILLQSGHAVVADFGIARGIAAAGGEKMTTTGVVIGTPSYMSPEQRAGSNQLDGRSDLYSLGCVLYEMLAGQPPFAGATAESIAYQHLSVAPRPVTDLRPTVPREVERAIQRTLSKAAADRFSSASEFAKALAHPDSPPVAAVPSVAPPPPAKPAHDRSAIAVLPFQNLSVGGPHAYFASGLHDELLTQLAKVAALKVISRTSVLGYQGTSKPLKQIASELGVGSVVEGSMQALGERLRVNVQLIDAATDVHLWAERYDRTLDDAFAIQSEVAQQIVAAVGAALTSAEQGRLTAAPTANAEAYRFYLQGRDYWSRAGSRRQNTETAQQLYERALDLDPDFALAHAALSQAHGRMYWYRYDSSAARAARQREEAECALRLAPDLPEAHIAMGEMHYWGRRDYRRAMDEFAIALKGLPSDARLWSSIGAVHRRLGNWVEAFAAFERAAQLNPRDATLFYDQGGTTFQFVRRYADAVRAYDKALSLAPDLHGAAIARGWTYVVWQGQLDVLAAVLGRLPKDAEGMGGSRDAQRAALLFWERNADALLRMLEVARVDVFESRGTFMPSAMYAAWAHQQHGDHAAARAAFDSARACLDSALSEHPDDERVHGTRGLALAGLGLRDEALREARWLQESAVYREDAFDGPLVASVRARILAQLGDAESALDEIERLMAGPSNLSVHTLRLDPLWDPIRDHPRFRALLAKYASATSSAADGKAPGQ